MSGGQFDTAAEALLARLGDLGVDYVFGNAGTDFPSIIEALAKNAGGGLPVPVAVPHENLAIAMAHGYYHATGRPQAVMLHVNVGTANAVCGLLNAQRDNIPILLFAGRTPVGEEDGFGARSVFIHWGQEMFDQAGMVREAVKWDYELRSPGQAAQVVERAYAIAMSEPRGPVYVTLPREVLAMPADVGATRRLTPPTPPAPAADAIEQLTEWVAGAANPLLITASYGRRPEDVAALADLAERHAIPVVAYRPRYVCLPTSHPMHLGFEPAALLKDADLVLVVDCDVPWIPRLHRVDAAARVVHIGADPLFGRYPMRSFRADLAITGAAPLTLRALDAALAARPPGADAAARRQRLAARKAEMRAQRRQAVTQAASQSVSTLAWVAACLNDVKRPDDLLVTESVFPLHLLDLDTPGGHFGTSPAGGLGWGLGESIGLKLAARQRRVIAVVGDGSYMFGNPTPAHYLCEALDLPILTIILNNGMWGAVRRATLSMYPDGAAAQSNEAPLTYLQPSPRFEHVVAASGGHAERVERAADLPAALARALHAVDVEGRQAVLNVICDYSDSAAAADSRR